MAFIISLNWFNSLFLIQHAHLCKDNTPPTYKNVPCLNIYIHIDGTVFYALHITEHIQIVNFHLFQNSIVITNYGSMEKLIVKV